MRFRHPDGSTVHLGYCSNVHPAETVEGVAGQLDRFAGPVRRALDTPVLGVGLWLSAAVVTELHADPAGLGVLRDALVRNGLEVVTCNGFPYGGFHAPAVKHEVYRPDWADEARLSYTLGVAGVLAELLPGDVEDGSVSTLPLGWLDDDWAEREKAALVNLERLAGGLEALRERTGRRVRVAVEPEPGCAVETAAEAARLLDGLAPEWAGACLDTCHLAVQFEEPGPAVAEVTAAGAGIVKAQLSSALRVPDPADHAWLHDYDEPRFLHQVRERVAYDGARVRNGLAGVDLSRRGVRNGVAGVDDVGRIGGLPGRSEWRVHFHVPIHADGGRTTQPELRAALRALAGGAAPATRHLEVETYTWTVLPAAERPAGDAGLVAGLARELAWARDQLTALGLESR